MTDRICIYCRAESPPSVFNREHVLQEGFGRFRNALVLHGMVCKDCNDHFSRTIDLVLARDSFEGLERYRWGVKSPDEVRRFLHRNVTLRAQDDMGEFSGAEIRLAPGDSERPFTAHILPSAAIRESEGDNYVHFTAAEIIAGLWKSGTVDPNRGIKLFGPESATAEMRAALEEEGVRLKYRPLTFIEPQSETTELGHEFRVTPKVKRAVAKIAFNYLACRQGAKFVLPSAFDPIRAFIREGLEPTLPPVLSGGDVPFRHGGPDGMVPVLHWVSLEAHRDHRNLLGVVSLFSAMTHTIVLAENFHGPWFDLPLAHLYNVKERIASELDPVKPRWRHPDGPAA